jgi:hypothetical protein
MQVVTGQISVAVCKEKSGGKIMTAGQLRDQDDIEKLIQQHDGYQILGTVMLLSSPTGNQQHGSRGYESIAGFCNAICDLVGS